MTSVVYDPSQTEVRIGGFALTGLTAVRIDRGNDSFKVVNGIHYAYSARIKNHATPLKMTVRLLQTSDSNAVLQDLYASSEVSTNSFVRVEVMSSNGSLDTKPNIASTGFISSAPSIVRGEEAVENEWTFVINSIENSALIELVY